MISSVLSDLVARVENAADVRGQVGVGTTFRHEQADVFRDINGCMRETRAFVVSKGFRFYLTSSTGTTPATPTTNENFSTIAIPDDCYSVQGVDVKVLGGMWRSLDRADWELRRHYDPRGVSTTGPNWYAVRNFPPTGLIALFPFGASLPFELWYLPEWTDVVTDGTPFTFQDELWRQRLVLSVAYRLSAIMDADRPQRAEAIASALRDNGTAIEASVPKLIQTGPRTMVRDRSRDIRWGRW